MTEHHVAPFHDTVGQQETPVRALAAGLRRRALRRRQTQHRAVIDRRLPTLQSLVAFRPQLFVGFEAGIQPASPASIVPRRPHTTHAGPTDGSFRPNRCQANAGPRRSPRHSRTCKCSRSASSKRSRKRPPNRRANRKFANAMRALASFRWPVGLAAKRTLIMPIAATIHSSSSSTSIRRGSSARQSLSSAAGHVVHEVSEFGRAAPAGIAGIDHLGVLAEREPRLQHFLRCHSRRATPLHRIRARSDARTRSPASVSRSRRSPRRCCPGRRPTDRVCARANHLPGRRDRSCRQARHAMRRNQCAAVRP